MGDEYTTVKIRTEDHRKLKIKGAEEGVFIVDILSKAIDLLGTMAWQPIETAPRDGRDIFLAQHNGARISTMQAFYGKGYGRFMIYGKPVFDQYKATHWMYVPGGIEHGEHNED